MKYVEPLQEDKVDRGEIREEYRISHERIASSGIRQCDKHTWRKLSDNELICTQCPTAIIVNADILESML